MDGRTSDIPLISIVTPTFNGIKFVIPYLSALSHWKRANVEVIVIDGGSDDGTLESLINSTGIDLIVSEPDDGIFDAMNKGVSICRGRYIGILNLDDRYLPKTIDLIAETLASNPISVIYGGLKVGEGESNLIHLSHRNIQTGMIGHPAMFIAKELYLAHGTYDCQYKVAADYELTYRFTKAGVNFVELPDVITEYTPGGFSASHENLSIIETTRIQQIHGSKGRLWFVFRSSLRVIKHQLYKLF